MRLGFAAQATSGSLVVAIYDSRPGDEIRVYDIITKAQVAWWGVPRDASSIAITGNIVVWADNREGRRDVYGYDIEKNREFLIAPWASNPSIDGSRVV